jgi:rhodanese-related sulfurtransferase
MVFKPAMQSMECVWEGSIVLNGITLLKIAVIGIRKNESQYRKHVPMEQTIERFPKRDETQMIPEYAADRKGLVTVDITWGEIQPIQVAPGVRTVGELEVKKHLLKGLPMIDVRASGTRYGVRIPGTKSIPISDIVDRMEELDRTRETIFFCNGPQCPQSPTAIKKLLDAGYPAQKIWYYRGGMHDWVTLGLPVKETGE